jgi:GWxTD domain-containing protein
VFGDFARRQVTVASIFLLLAAITSCGPPHRQQGWLGRGRAWFSAQLLSGFSPDGHELATLIVSVPYRNLVFFAAGDGYAARYRVRAIQKRGNEALRAQEWTGEVFVVDYSETRSQRVVEKTVQLELASQEPADLLNVEVRVSVEGTQRQSSLAIPYERADVDAGGVSLADAEFYVLRDGAEASASASFELQSEKLPDPERYSPAPSPQFDLATGEPWLWVRVFDLRATPRTAIRLRVRATKHSPAWAQDIDLESSGVESSYLLKIPASALVFGNNELRVELEGANARNLTLENLGLDLRDDRSWKANLSHVDPLAESSEMRTLRAAPPEARAAAWSEFWARRDPNPHEPGNERLREHYRRVAYARRNLRDGVGDGSISDRGRVYIRHGPPATIEESASRFDLLTSWQVWSYPSLGIVYYFRLVHGGNYRLAWSEGI